MILNMNNQELELIIKHLNKTYNWDKTRIQQWLTTSNINFNFSKPLDFIEKNLGYKVLEFIENDEQNVWEVK